MLCDGETDSCGLQWPLHVRDRLPLDLLSCLPGAVKALGNRRGTQASAAAAAGSMEEGALPGGMAEDGEPGNAVTEPPATAEGSAAMHQFRPQLQASAGMVIACVCLYPGLADHCIYLFTARGIGLLHKHAEPVLTCLRQSCCCVANVHTHVYAGFACVHSGLAV